MKVKLRMARGELELDGRIENSEQRGYFLFTFRTFPSRSAQYHWFLPWIMKFNQSLPLSHLDPLLTINFTSSNRELCSV